MDYLPGDSCKDLIKKREITPLRALEILKNVATALNYVHSHGYIHCDIKPDNIMFRNNGEAVLTDFGIARELPDEKTHSVAGTPYYMSPEQAQGQKLDKTSDIYSLGIVLYEMLTFQLPYLGKDPIAIAIKHVSAPAPQLPDELESLSPLLNKMVAKRPGARFQNCNELIHAIEFTESQYLKQSGKALPLKLRLAFAMQKTKSRLNHMLGLRKKLIYSYRHGLLLKLVDDDVPFERIESIAKTMEHQSQTINTITTLNMGKLSHDSLALALQTEQARKLLPAPLANTILALLIALLLAPVLGEIITTTMNRTSKPEIIYVE